MDKNLSCVWFILGLQIYFMIKWNRLMDTKLTLYIICIGINYAGILLFRNFFNYFIFWYE
jgi:hypothetical protein